MIVYLAGFKTLERYYSKSVNDIWLLSSFFEHKTGRFGNYVYQDKHILDSGAFSTFKDPAKAQNFDWDSYVRKYIQFINHSKQKLFFEMDIDCVVGLKKVEYYRKQIEDGTGRQPVPVWHFERGWNYFEMMCECYPYVALGTVPVAKQGKLIRKNPLVLKRFIDTAHKSGAKIHGLGFTLTNYLDRLKFDSIDSTTWLAGGRYGKIYQFAGNRMIYISPPKGYRAINHRITQEHNFNEWVKFQKYAEQNL